ncbi:MAG: hypothetical protein RMK40_05790 [Chloroflexota bacterium]|nr:hypothetical protein [Chloroflexota bacterium]
MVSIPPFLLRRLYVKGSLRRTEHGFEFQLRNQLGSGYARQMLPLKVDDREVPLENCSFLVDGTETPFVRITPERPFTLALNRTTTVKVRGVTLEPGAHKITVGFVVQGFGALSFDFTEVVS